MRCKEMLHASWGLLRMRMPRDYASRIPLLWTLYLNKFCWALMSETLAAL